MTPDLTLNLSALAERLVLEERHRVLAGKIQRACELHSLSVDLAMALEALDAFDKLLGGAIEDFDTDALKSALLNNAIILYARATKTDSRIRRPFDVRPRLTDAQKTTHDELVKLRDDAVAHFGSGGNLAGEWQSSLLVLQFKDGIGRLGAITKRQTFDGNLAHRLRKQLEVVHEILRAIALEKLDEATEALNVAMIEHPDLVELARRFPVNLDVFFASADAAEQARSAYQQGFWKGSVKLSRPRLR